MPHYTVGFWQYRNTSDGYEIHTDHRVIAKVYGRDEESLANVKMLTEAPHIVVQLLTCLAFFHELDGFWALSAHQKIQKILLVTSGVTKVLNDAGIDYSGILD